MFKKFFAAVLIVAAGAVSAANIIDLQLNFYSKDGGTVRPAGKLPDGVTVGKRIRFSNPKMKGFAYPVRIDFDKVKTVDLKFVVSAGNGKIAPSLYGFVTGPDGRTVGKFVFKCTAMELCGESSPRKLPLVIEKWINMFPPWGTPVLEGDTVTVSATFEKAE